MGDALHRVGLQSGDDVIVHSTFRSLKPFVKHPRDVIGLILNCIGSTGNLMLPTFTSSPRPDPFYDPNQTPGQTGIISECGRQYAQSLRSLHPTHSVAVIGPDAQGLTCHHLQGRAFGVNSPLDQLAQRGGKILLLGVGHTANSMIHVAEEHAGIPKPPAHNPMPHVSVRMPDGHIIKHQLDTSPSCSAAFEAVAYSLRRERLIRDARIGSCLIQLIPARELIANLVELLHDHPSILKCTNPYCLKCCDVESSTCSRHWE